MEFLNMGGYAFHVWSAYGIVLLVLAANLAAPIVRHRRLARSLSASPDAAHRVRAETRSPPAP